jgi:hypothetical protein
MILLASQQQDFNEEPDDQDSDDHLHDVDGNVIQWDDEVATPTNADIANHRRYVAELQPDDHEDAALIMWNRQLQQQRQLPQPFVPDDVRQRFSNANSNEPREHSLDKNKNKNQD